MAYKASSLSNRTSAGGSPSQGRPWEDSRKEARKLEGELDVKLAAYGKLCSGFEASYKLKTETSALGADQLAHGKAAEIEDLLRRLADVNNEMGGAIGSSSSDSRSHTLARHRDILLEFTQEFRRLVSTLDAARDRMQLLAGGDDASPLLSVQVQGTGGALRERAAISSSSAAVDEVLQQAAGVSSNLIDQRRVFDNVQDKILAIGARFPVVNSLLNAIRRKKSKDTLVLSAVIAACALFTLVYLFYK